ncbi:MAG: serine/threonine protein kinase [Kiritimatiellae bacterium]|nr:serine/threonine protein kinase [Kiritimatiellia bacterium]
MADLKADDMIGVYRIVRLLGKGAIGAVYEVVHTHLGVHYALKAFTLDHGHVDVIREKFIAEGRVLARLGDPRIVRVVDLNFDEATKTLYFVMDLVLGKDGAPHTLADIEPSTLEEECVWRWFCDLAAALDYIHAQGIVHRDVKLRNVLLNADDRVVLSDFGVSRLFSKELRREVNAETTMVEGSVDSRLVMGTHGYMAPEVERGEESTPAADVYSLAVMIVYLLTGVLYAPGSMALQLLEVFELPWSEVLPQMLAEDPKDRPTSLGAIAERLMGQTAMAQAARRRRRIVVAVVLAAAVVASAACWLAFRRHSASSFDENAVRSAFGAEGIYEVVK